LLNCCFGSKLFPITHKAANQTKDLLPILFPTLTKIRSPFLDLWLEETWKLSSPITA
jgi:hypothetical protein